MKMLKKTKRRRAPWLGLALYRGDGEDRHKTGCTCWEVQGQEGACSAHSLTADPLRWLVLARTGCMPQWVLQRRGT